MNTFSPTHPPDTSQTLLFEDEGSFKVLLTCKLQEYESTMTKYAKRIASLETVYQSYLKAYEDNLAFWPK